jgi:hypothetical protein
MNRASIMTEALKPTELFGLRWCSLDDQAYERTLEDAGSVQALARHDPLIGDQRMTSIITADAVRELP